ncbi:MAG: oligosaccharide flippase family protein [Chloroflexota bacterium]
MLGNAAWVLGTHVLMQGASGVYLILVARWLGPETLGVYSAIWAVMWLFDSLCKDGLAVAVTREIARAPERTQHWTASGMCAGLALTLASMAGVPLVMFALGYDRWVVEFAALGGLTLLPKGPAGVLSGVLQARHRFDAYSALFVLSSVTNASFGITLVALDWGILGILVAFGASNVLTLLASVVLTRRIAGELPSTLPPVRDVWGVLRTAAPFVSRALLAGVHARADMVLVSLIAGFGAAGIYRSAYKLVEVIAYIPSSVGRALFPVSSALVERSDGRLRTMFERQTILLAVTSVPVAAGVAILGGPAVLLLVGPEYGATAALFPYLGPLIVLLFVGSPIETVAASTPDQRRFTLLRLACAAASIAIGALFIYLFGVVGAAAAAVFSSGLGSVVFHRFIRRRLGPTGVPAGLARVVAAAGLGLATALTLGRVDPWLMCLGLVTYAVGLRVLGIPDAGQMSVVRRAFQMVNGIRIRRAAA